MMNYDATTKTSEGPSRMLDVPHSRPRSGLEASSEAGLAASSGQSSALGDGDQQPGVSSQEAHEATRGAPTAIRAGEMGATSVEGQAALAASLRVGTETGVRPAASNGRRREKMAWAMDIVAAAELQETGVGLAMARGARVEPEVQVGVDRV